jgi:hypothetical protein
MRNQTSYAETLREDGAMKTYGSYSYRTAKGFVRSPIVVCDCDGLNDLWGAPPVESDVYIRHGMAWSTAAQVEAAAVADGAISGGVLVLHGDQTEDGADLARRAGFAEVHIAPNDGSPDPWMTQRFYSERTDA